MVLCVSACVCDCGCAWVYILDNDFILFAQQLYAKGSRKIVINLPHERRKVRERGRNARTTIAIKSF